MGRRERGKKEKWRERRGERSPVPLSYFTVSLACVASIPVWAEQNEATQKSFLHFGLQEKCGFTRPELLSSDFCVARMQKTPLHGPISFNSYRNTCYTGFSQPLPSRPSDPSSWSLFTGYNDRSVPIHTPGLKGNVKTKYILLKNMVQWPRLELEPRLLHLDRVVQSPIKPTQD